MKDWIKNLLALQETDLRLRQLSTRLEMIPIEISRIENDIKADEEKLHKTRERDMSTKLEIKKVESEIMKCNDKTDKLQQQSSMVKKNDEYKALLNEIEYEKKKISELETRELELMDEMDTIRKSIKQDEKLFENRKKILLSEKEELQELEETVKKQIEKISAERPKLLAPIDDSILSLYSRLINKGVGSPVVEVHNGNCGNCHLKLTPQTVNIARKQEVGTCENCGYILYIGD